MKLVYFIESTIRFNEKMLYEGVGIACATEKLAEREISKSVDHLRDIKDDLGYGESVWEYYYRDGAGVYHMIFQYRDNGTLVYTWRIHGTELIESYQGLFLFRSRLKQASLWR